MNGDDLLPKKSNWDSKELDAESIRLVQELLKGNHVNTDHLEIGGNGSNIDGYIELLDNNDYIEATITVQVKHLTHPSENGRTFYDIPGYLVAYAKRIKTHVVLFITCDTNHKTFYWKYIDENFIEEFIQASPDHIQQSYRYTFKPEETTNQDGVKETLRVWRQLYFEKRDSIKDQRAIAEKFAQIQQTVFNATETTFHGINDSHIHRKEVDLLLEWAMQPQNANNNDNNVALLVGDAGVGKSVVIRDLISKLEENDIKTLCIKADSAECHNDKWTLESLLDIVNVLSFGQSRFVVLIDQIDALSQYLSNKRETLKILLMLVNALQDTPHVKTIISCRKYDAEFDPALKNLHYSRKITLGLLSEAEVRSVVGQLKNGLGQELTTETVTILQVAQYLNVFCKLFKSSRGKVNYNNPIALYDDLWDYFIEENAARYSSGQLEDMLFHIAGLIHNSDTLSPIWTPSSAERPIVDHLASKGAIIYREHQVSFFHQSFFDYALARYYSIRQQSFITDLENRFQGLETRSTLKLILDYERGHNEAVYQKEILRLLSSSNIRRHLKYLIVSVLAATPKPKPFEKRILKEIIAVDDHLLAYFLRGVYEEGWFGCTLSILKPLMCSLDQEAALFSPISRFLITFAARHSRDVFSLIDDITDEETRLAVASYVLRGHNDYSNDNVVRYYHLINADYLPDKIQMIQDAVGSNLSFALAETGKAIQEWLHPGKTQYNQHVGYELVDCLVKQLVEEHPLECLCTLNTCILEVFKKHSTSVQGSEHSYNTVFSEGHDEYKQQLIDYYKQLLIRFAGNTSIVNPTIHSLIDLKVDTSLSLAFEVMSHNPQIYRDEIKSIVASDKELDTCLSGSFDYWFIEMLRQWYPTLDREEAVWYQHRLLEYRSSIDNIWNRTYRDLPILWYWGEQKWMLVCATIPPDKLIEPLRRCKLELVRRMNGREYVNEPREHSVMASVCRGITSEKAYRTFSTNTWLQSFLKLEETSRQFVDLRLHAEEFSKCVAERPNYFKPFVIDLFDRSDIKPIYLIAGLNGLQTAKVEPSELWPLFQKLNTSAVIHRDSYRFLQTIQPFIFPESPYTDEAIHILTEIIVMPYERTVSYGEEKDTDAELIRLATDMLSHAINTPQGHALEQLIHICAIKDKRPHVYNLLMRLCPRLHDDLRLMVIRYLYTEEYYDEPLFDKLYPQYLSECGPEAMAVLPILLQQYYYCKRELVKPYIARIEKDSIAHELLAQIYFFGIGHDEVRGECEEHLGAILDNDDTDVVKRMIEVAFRNISEPGFFSISKNILLRFADDTREPVREVYMRQCDKLPAEEFDLFRHIMERQHPDTASDIHNIIEYLDKCIEKRPIQCLEFIQSHRLFGVQPYGYNDKQLVELLLSIYRGLAKEGDETYLNTLMDLIDEYTFSMNSEMNHALALVERA